MPSTVLRMLCSRFHWVVRVAFREFRRSSRLRSASARTRSGGTLAHLDADLTIGLITPPSAPHIVLLCVAVCRVTFAILSLCQQLHDDLFCLLQSVLKGLITDRILAGAQIIYQRLEFLELLSLLVHLDTILETILV